MGCHVLLMMPLLGLGLFVLLPWPVALPSYLVLVAVSLALYAKVVQAMRHPVRTGREAMLGAVVYEPRTFTAEDLLKFEPEERIYRLRCVETWSMAIPWIGFSLRKLLDLVEPTSEAKKVVIVIWTKRRLCGII